jgi:hypothetical protein
MSFHEEDRIEHIHGYSHCRCRNISLPDGSFSCQRYKKTSKIKIRKLNLPEDQQCYYNSNLGYCELSRIDEIDLIQTIVKKTTLGSVEDRLKKLTITTRPALNLLKQMGIKNEYAN